MLFCEKISLTFLLFLNSRYEEAYRDARGVLTNEPTNKVIQPVLARLHDIVQKRHHENTLTINKVKQMFEIAFDMAADSEKRETALNNLLVLARERAGSDAMWEGGIISKIAKLIKVEKNEAIYLAAVRIISELCKSNLPRTKKILQELGVPWFLDVLNSQKEDRVNAAQYCLQVCIL